jgi:cell division protein FtsN
MEDQTTWRGHGFTLFVFGGIVFLCATFFVLGMLVGRSHEQKYAGGNGADAKKAQASTSAPDFTVDELRKDSASVPTIVVPPEELEAPEDPSVADPEEPIPAETSVNIQVGAFLKRSAAEKLVKDLSKLGFKALIIPPSATDKSPLYYRVQVGPYEDAPDADSARQKLESAGYHPRIKK